MKNEELDKLMRFYKDCEVFEYEWTSSVFDEEDNVVGTTEKLAFVFYDFEEYIDDHGRRRNLAGVVAYEGDELDDDADFNEDEFLEKMNESEEAYAEIAPYLSYHYI